MDKKERVAAALGYNRDSDQAPKLLAKGRGHIADKIIEIGQENDTPVYQDERLSKQLQHLEVGQMIPEDLYNVVAEVLVFISKMDARFKK
ncbi:MULTISPECIES: EscU/YscU/HrcU family type III secretion system export apparatus switch protein [unclassified Fusibacter]|uniref:EscU/YscU/HrcU family type III secretion system export apparatus switch protein n=1 Tax=unclassified Fusibacter TaxID=2624464 RepID=UPI00101229BA|nr:EscU/YscU/HrcU family type III secretion system export apparatus switch protein [Fusibacter sp. A1]MCK8059069.1 EscU/YscU/HrcU family type III secretion system export apparatus switch protein [Fusibacter sp. A2]NPE22478.1 flagellar biosynthesis protein FlhB [Fusibacter sp. A1]RXV60582.1 flagellar biosynthesis protein FlhB [Fusibacter sp. A1]